jgi:flagellar biosynthetic protein FliR
MIFQTWSTEELLSFFMVFVRMSVLMALVPLFGDKVIPAPVKILLSLTFSVVLFPILRANGVVQVQDAVQYGSTVGRLVLTVFSEVLVGLSIGFASQLVFHAIHAAGELMSTYMGFGMASMYDPHTESQTLIISQVLGALGMLVFLAVDGHHVILRALVESYRMIQIGHFAAAEVFQKNLITMTGQVMGYAVQLSAPMSACMLLVNVVYGVLGKALPQLNILTLSMASGVLIGSLVLLISYPSLQSGMISLYDTYFSDLKSYMVAYGGK